MNLTTAERRKFQEKGLLTLKGFVSTKDLTQVNKTIHNELERLKIKTKGKISAGKIQDLPLFQQSGVLSQMVRLGPEVDRLFPAELFQFIQSLGESKFKAAHPHPQLLLSLPHKEEWSLKNLNWHLDIKVPNRDEIPGIQAFVLIDEVKPRGGATLAIAGSHRLHYIPEAQGGNAHGVLRRDKNFSGLFENSSQPDEKLFKPHDLYGVETQVVEMSGKAGDVFLMDMRILHSPSVNATKSIRKMATQRYVKN